MKFHFFISSSSSFVIIICSGFPCIETSFFCSMFKGGDPGWKNVFIYFILFRFSRFKTFSPMDYAKSLNFFRIASETYLSEIITLLAWNNGNIMIRSLSVLSVIYIEIFCNDNKSLSFFSAFHSYSLKFTKYVNLLKISDFLGIISLEN